MEIEKSVSNWIVKPTQESVNETFEYIKNNYSEFQKNHIIIDFSKKININIKELMLFLDLSVNHKRNGMSFVLVSEGIDID